MNSKLKWKGTKGSRKQTHKTVLKTKSRNKNYQQKDNIELITFFKKHDFDKTYKDSKTKWHKHNVLRTRTQQEILKNKPKTER